jgi:UDP-glucose:(glucosyl)LPS alpha-1,2-glucosyltransferase
MKRVVAHLLPDHNPFPPTYAAGTELRVEQVARRQRRYRALVVCGWFKGQSETEEQGSMRIRRVRIGRVYRRLFRKITHLDPLPYTERIWRIVVEEMGEILHIHNEPKVLAGLHHRLMRSELPVVVHVANEKPLPKDCLNRVTRWVACSRYIRDWLVDANAVAADRVQIIYTGVDTAARQPVWETARQRRDGLRRRFGVVDPNITVLSFAGRIVKEKGVNELLDAFEILRARDPGRIALLVAGNLRESNDPRNEKAVYGRAVAARMAKMQGVHWVGSLTPDEIHGFLTAADIFVMPSLWHDPFPTVMLEAAAAGLPIVAAARGGITEFLQGCPEFRFLADPKNAEELAAAIDLLAKAPERREAAGRWLRAKVERDFDWQRVCDDFERLYDTLIRRDSSR